MSDAPASDSYATAKANLRDTIKWLATSLAAIGAAVIAGASISGLASIEGKALWWAAGLGGVGLLLILIATGMMLNLLTSKVFYFSELTNEEHPITKEINAHASDILSPQIKTIKELVAVRDAAVTTAQTAKPDDPAYNAAYKQWTAANEQIARLTSLAQFLALRRDFQKQKWILFILTILVILTLGGYAVLIGGKSKLSEDLAQKIVFTPGANWSGAASLIAKVCGEKPLNGIMLPKKTFQNWVTIKLEEPDACSGLELSIPASLVTLVGPKP
jgi:hypothetical protein